MTRHDFTPVSPGKLVDRLPQASQVACINLHAQWTAFSASVQKHRSAGNQAIAQMHARQADQRMRDLESVIMKAFRADGPEIEAQNWARRHEGQRS